MNTQDDFREGKENGKHDFCFARCCLHISASLCSHFSAQTWARDCLILLIDGMLHMFNSIVYEAFLNKR